MTQHNIVGIAVIVFMLALAFVVRFTRRGRPDPNRWQAWQAGGVVVMAVVLAVLLASHHHFMFAGLVLVAAAGFVALTAVGVRKGWFVRQDPSSKADQ